MLQSLQKSSGVVLFVHLPNLRILAVDMYAPFSLHLRLAKSRYRHRNIRETHSVVISQGLNFALYQVCSGYAFHTEDRS